MQLEYWIGVLLFRGQNHALGMIWWLQTFVVRNPSANMPFKNWFTTREKRWCFRRRREHHIILCTAHQSISVLASPYFVKNDSVWHFYIAKTTPFKEGRSANLWNRTVVLRIGFCYYVTMWCIFKIQNPSMNLSNAPMHSKNKAC